MLGISKNYVEENKFVYSECNFFKSLIQRNKLLEHLEKYYAEKLFYIFECAYYGSNENLRRCLVKKIICDR